MVLHFSPDGWFLFTVRPSGNLEGTYNLSVTKLSNVVASVKSVLGPHGGSHTMIKLSSPTAMARIRPAKLCCESAVERRQGAGLWVIQCATSAPPKALQCG